MSELTSNQLIEAAPEWTPEMEASWQDNQDALEQPWIEAEQANERRFAQWLAYPGDR